MKNKVGTIVGRVLICILTAVVLAAILLIAFLGMVCRGKSDAARRVFVSTMLETGALKWVPGIFLSDKEIENVVVGNKREPFEHDLDSSLIKIEANAGAGNQAGGAGSGQESVTGQRPEEEDIEVIPIKARTFMGNLMIVKDPSRLSIAAPHYDFGKNMDMADMVKKYDAVAGINGGMFKNSGISGNGRAMGVVVSNGKILENRPTEDSGLILIYMNNKNILFYQNIDGWSTKDVEDFVAKEGVRDAIVFQEGQNVTLDHFVPLIVNNVPREIQGFGSGCNPRTCIGQRADGAILMLVTDGRGSGSHIGATAADLIEVMGEYGAVNAFNIDGGSSSCMYYKDEYLISSATLLVSNSSWSLPDGWIVK